MEDFLNREECILEKYGWVVPYLDIGRFFIIAGDGTVKDLIINFIRENPKTHFVRIKVKVNFGEDSGQMILNTDEKVHEDDDLTRKIYDIKTELLDDCFGSTVINWARLTGRPIVRSIHVNHV